jgi:hypothetical protein
MEDATEKHIVTPGPLMPAREMLAELLLESGDAKGAYGEYVKTLEREPGRRRTLQGAATAAEKAGDSSNAQKYRQQVGPSAAGPVPVSAQAEEVDPCPCRACRQS